eukprot:CAMPEP_0201488358 /NCGR_PEP_ID=MMETSP0151_2-20130828/17913_1 /ASSEMBLY_ACC=CAM_ASM_000257 /TAXON_ID=200890 /ORGANISM="Paramoeba atlantica, Strain 621/1 / CCAP 1560/9" /LENGTH=161 /DNA_ID=CAMNT_0047873627 /DNA_START=23 /DNA_END=508 /DNA_ORIENTATION=+
MTSEEGKGGPIPLQTLNLQELMQVKKQIEEEIDHFQSSLMKFEMVIRRFRNSKESLVSLNKENKGKEILMPLTTSLYVPGKLGNVETVLVDIGTGYYVEKPIGEAANYLNRQIRLVHEQVANLEETLEEKTKHRETVMSVIQQKINSAGVQQQQQQQPTRK